jgi:hypothetical protein
VGRLEQLTAGHAEAGGESPEPSERPVLRASSLAGRNPSTSAQMKAFLVKMLPMAMAAMVQATGVSRVAARARLVVPKVESHDKIGPR